jgi:arginyl-tRNA synthetase
MLISYMREVAPEALADVDNVDLGDLVVFYKNAKKWFDTTEANQDVSRAEVVKLQGGDAQSLKLWKIIVANSAKAFNEIYDTLDVRGLELRGESFYNPMLKDTVDVLTAQGLTVDDDGATCVPLEGFFQRQTKEDAAAGKPQVPAKMIVQKREGGFLYATTDLAAVRHRTDTEKASRVIYCTDAGQALHFQQVFQIAERAGWGKTASLEHVPFGLVCGEDGGKLKTRSGETTKLSDLLDTAVIFAHAVMLQMYQAELEKVEEKGDAGDGDRKEWLKGRLSPYLPGGRLDQIVATLKQITSVNEGEPEWFEARDLLKALLAEGGDDWLEKEAGPAVGLGSVKFADLSMTRTNDYRFSYRRMVDFQGKSAPFMLYQFVRIKSIVRKFGGADVVETPNGGLELANANSCQFILVKPAERDLARHCLDFSRTLSEVEKTLLPHRTCDYMCVAASRRGARSLARSLARWLAREPALLAMCVIRVAS